MLRLCLYRIPQMVIVLLAVTMLAFFLVNILPGNILYTILGDNYTPQAAAVVSKELGLNHPAIIRYFLWLGHAVHFDFGKSLLTGLPVSQTLKQDALPSIELVIGGQIVGTGSGILFAILAVATRIGWIDRLGTGFALFFTSMPGFVLAILLLAVFGVHWRIIPTIGWVNPSQGGWGANLKAIALPMILLGLGLFPGNMRVFRSELYEQMENEEYVTLARMKGITTRRLMLRHVARNSAFGLITVVAVQSAALIAGAVILEQIFGIPGIGDLLLNAINDRDPPTVEACILCVGVLVVVFNLLADLVYALLDPRVRDAQF